MDATTKRKRGRPPKVKPFDDGQTVDNFVGGPTAEVPAKEPVREPGSKYYVTRRDGSQELRKVRWNRKAVEGRFPMIEVYPEVTTIVTWQGVSYWLTEGIAANIPQPHADIYREVQRNMHLRKQTMTIVEGQPVHVSPNAGGLDNTIEGLDV